MAASPTPCVASYATTGSLARVQGPPPTVTPGSSPERHVRPASLDAANPIASAPPLTKRPTWKVETTVEPNAAADGSTSVRCWPSPGVVSTESRSDTVSQSRPIRSNASATRTSRPRPQLTVSGFPSAVESRSACGVP